ncbi:MAG: hypothetical protein RI947_172 [Candidatus Parcubacteria bacterium]|jgi:hypothetical protein
MKKKTGLGWKILLGVGVIFIALQWTGAAYDRGYKAGSKSIVDTVIKPNISDENYTQEQKEMFMKSCEKEGVSNSYCICIFNYLMERITYSQLVSDGVELSKTGQAPEYMDAATKYCEN